ncbi:PhzF family phenazine biosynthesis protein [Paenibacillus oralis]|uniref:PhzF family phenazine biosynthesis protein n=1 Tax=Paenibacillus oralis TaxID=2490856 RepID=UPI0026B5B430
MKKVKVLHYDAFSSVVNAKVFYARTRNELMRSCYHRRIICPKNPGAAGGQNIFHIETNVGVLPVSFENKGEQILITMQQDAPRFIPFEGDVQKLAESIGLAKEDLDLSKPIVYGSTGTWTLLIPIKELSKFKTMQPRNEDFPQILAENPRSSVHPICFEAHDEKALMHARHFSSPFSGTVEDPVTGTASGVMGAYYLKYIDDQLPMLEFAVEQGQEIGRDGRVWVRAVRNGAVWMFLYRERECL